jgi:hypothetical protein
LPKTWAAKLRDFEGELDIVRSSTRRMHRLVAKAEFESKRTAE